MSWIGQRTLYRRMVRGRGVYVTWHPTNWTFGVWWGRLTSGAAGGLDLGPIEVHWSRRVTRRPTA